MHDIFNILVVEKKIVPIDYFMDVMQPWEVSNILQHIECSDRTAWEQTRLLMYVIAQVNSTKKLSPKDLITFSWEKTKQLSDTSISNDDIKRLQEKSKLIQQNVL